MPGPLTEIGGAEGSFPLTRWSLVARAEGADASARQRALDDLVRAYWRPLYVFLRASGRGNEEAKDLVQGFFALAMEKGTLASFDPSRGKFRTFLLTCIKNFWANEREREQALKRGGGAAAFSLDDALDVPAAEPEEAFDRAWASAKLTAAVERVRKGLTPEHAVVLDAYLSSEDVARPGYERLSSSSGLTENQVRHLLHDLRKRIREEVLAEVRSEATDELAAQDELAWVLRVSAGA